MDGFAVDGSGRTQGKVFSASTHDGPKQRAVRVVSGFAQRRILGKVPNLVAVVPLFVADARLQLAAINRRRREEVVLRIAELQRFPSLRESRVALVRRHR
jgi:hypothetical protein